MRRVALLVAFAGLTFAGCGKHERVPTYPVSGRVIINGKPPPAGWTAALHLEPPPDPNAPYPHPIPRAKIGPDGRFLFRTYESSDGVPAGTYKISFIDTRRPGETRDTEDENAKITKKAKEDKKHRQVYWSTPIEIRPEANELPPFDLKVQ